MTNSRQVIYNQEHCAWVGPRTIPILNIYILVLRPLSSISIMCKYADDLFQLCPQRSFVALEGDDVHIQEWAQVNKISINISEPKEIVFKRRSHRSYTRPSPIVHTEQVSNCFVSSMLTRVNYKTVIMSQELYSSISNSPY